MTCQAPAPGPPPPAIVERLTSPALLEQLLAKLDANLAPNDRAGLRRRASLLRGLGRVAEASSTYRALIALDPHDEIAQIGAAVCSGAPVPVAACGATPFVQLHDALHEDQQDRLWNVLMERSATLTPTSVYREGGVSHVDPTRRVAQRLGDVTDLRAWFLPWLEDLIAQTNILPRLGLDAFTVSKRELQVTGHGDGGFFSIHSDASDHPSLPAWSRHLTFIYYFHRLPRPFSGGDLLLFDAPGGGDLSFTRIEPVHNSIVFFASHHLHTVTRIHCPSPDPFDGRWTVNGWLHRHSNRVRQGS